MSIYKRSYSDVGDSFHIHYPSFAIISSLKWFYSIITILYWLQCTVSFSIKAVSTHYNWICSIVYLTGAWFIFLLLTTSFLSEQWFWWWIFSHSQTFVLMFLYVKALYIIFLSVLFWNNFYIKYFVLSLLFLSYKICNIVYLSGDWCPKLC